MNLFEKIKSRTNPIKYWKSKGARIGSDCEIYGTVSFGSEPYLVEVGNHVRINSRVEFVTHDGGVWVLRNFIPNCERIDLIRPIKVGNNVHIGTNSIIMPGVTIGDNCIVGCGAIVTKNIPSNSVAAGIPARVIETVNEYYRKNREEFINTKNMTEEQKKELLLKKFDFYEKC